MLIFVKKLALAGTLHQLIHVEFIDHHSDVFTKDILAFLLFLLYYLVPHFPFLLLLLEELYVLVVGEIGVEMHSVSRIVEEGIWTGIISIIIFHYIRNIIMRLYFGVASWSVREGEDGVESLRHIAHVHHPLHRNVLHLLHAQTLTAWHIAPHITPE